MGKPFVFEPGVDEHVFDAVCVDSVVDVLLQAHKAGLVHWDVRPANMYTAEDSGQFFLNDWGCARKMGTAASFEGGLKDSPNRVLELVSTSSEVLPVAADLVGLARSLLRKTVPINPNWFPEQATMAASAKLWAKRWTQVDAACKGTPWAEVFTAAAQATIEDEYANFKKALHNALRVYYSLRSGPLVSERQPAER